MPPPRVRPATPVEARKPDGVAMPNATVAWSTSAQVQPASARTVRSGRVDRGAAQQRQVDDQGAVGHPEPGRAVAAAADGDLGAVARGRTARRLMTSAASRQRAIAAGCLSIMAL